MHDMLWMQVIQQSFICKYIQSHNNSPTLQVRCNLPGSFKITIQPFSLSGWFQSSPWKIINVPEISILFMLLHFIARIHQQNLGFLSYIPLNKCYRKCYSNLSYIPFLGQNPVFTVHLPIFTVHLPIFTVHYCGAVHLPKCYRKCYSILSFIHLPKFSLFICLFSLFITAALFIYLNAIENATAFFHA